ncbi:MAG: hypothetical protein Q9P01_14520 [Anaerolineae bacterium]|nr:hypothetical protein [Anaerolineae bacterium]
MYQFSHLGRPVDLRFRTNRIISILMLVSGIVAFVAAFITDMGFSNALSALFVTAFATFITWALAREIDPDHDWSAFVAVVLVWLALLYFTDSSSARPIPQLGWLSMGLILASTRIVSRIIGLPLRISDSVLVLVGIAMAVFFDNWVIALIPIAALFLDGIMVNPLRRHLAFSGLASVMVILWVQFRGFPETQGLASAYIVAVTIVSAGFFLTIAATRKITSVPDLDTYTLDIRRIRAAMILALAAGLVSVLRHGDNAVITLLPLWCAMIAVAVYRVPITVQEWMAYRKRKVQPA